jgi:prepilin-type N-terminal cleavage/methylation domain-containing protein
MLLHQKTRSKNRQGLTLLELIVVMVILVAVAGIVVPLLPNVLSRAHSAVGSTNAGEVDRLIQAYQQTYQTLPDYLDDLVDPNSGSKPLDYLPGYSGGTNIGQLVPYQLLQADLSALNNIGIKNVAVLFDSTSKFPVTPPVGTPTFNPYQYNGSNILTQPLAVGTWVAKLTESAAETPPGIVRDDPNGNTFGDIYLVFGFGKQTTAIGRVSTDAPVHFSEFAGDNASSVYCRYGLVFRTQRGTGASPTSTASTPLSQAVFMGAVSFEPTGIMGADGQLANYYDVILKQQ